MQVCISCGGLGWIEKNDCGDGTTEICPLCDGSGENVVDDELVEIIKEDENAKTKNQMPRLW